MYKCKYFKPQELVSGIVYSKFGEDSYMFFDEDVLKELDYIREAYGYPICINNWHMYGQYKESGLRSNVDSLVSSKKNLYLSAHCLAKAFDLKDFNNIKGNNKRLYNFVLDLMKQGKLKKFRRLENITSTPTWVHIDCFQTKDNRYKIFC
jgi:hypothetical protein